MAPCVWGVRGCIVNITRRVGCPTRGATGACARPPTNLHPLERVPALAQQLLRFGPLCARVRLQQCVWGTRHVCERVTPPSTWRLPWRLRYHCVATTARGGGPPLPNHTPRSPARSPTSLGRHERPPGACPAARPGDGASASWLRHDTAARPARSRAWELGTGVLQPRWCEISALAGRERLCGPYDEVPPPPRQCSWLAKNTNPALQAGSASHSCPHPSAHSPGVTWAGLQALQLSGRPGGVPSTPLL